MSDCSWSDTFSTTSRKQDELAPTIQEWSRKVVSRFPPAPIRSNAQAHRYSNPLSVTKINHWKVSSRNWIWLRFRLGLQRLLTYYGCVHRRPASLAYQIFDHQGEAQGRCHLPEQWQVRTRFLHQMSIFSSVIVVPSVLMANRPPW
jgi:hypothetical protein